MSDISENGGHWLQNDIYVKFGQYIASLYPHIFTNFGRFILICYKMVLIILGVGSLLIVFNVSSFEFHQVKLP